METSAQLVAAARLSRVAKLALPQAGRASQSIYLYSHHIYEYARRTPSTLIRLVIYHPSHHQLETDRTEPNGTER